MQHADVRGSERERLPGPAVDDPHAAGGRLARQDLGRLVAGHVHAEPEFARGEVAHDGHCAAEMVGVAVRDDQRGEAADAARP